MRSTSLFFFLLCVLLLSGCATDDKLVIQTKYVPVMPSDDLIADCHITAPPDRAAYLKQYQDDDVINNPKLTPSEKELILAVRRGVDREGKLLDWSQALLVDLAKCNVQLKAVRQFKQEATEKISTITKKEGK